MTKPTRGADVTVAARETNARCRRRAKRMRVCIHEPGDSLDRYALQDEIIHHA